MAVATGTHTQLPFADVTATPLATSSRASRVPGASTIPQARQSLGTAQRLHFAMRDNGVVKMIAHNCDVAPIAPGATRPVHRRANRNNHRRFRGCSNPEKMIQAVGEKAVRSCDSGPTVRRRGRLCGNRDQFGKSFSGRLKINFLPGQHAESISSAARSSWNHLLIELPVGAPSAASGV
jgi:hypothetical protein